MGRKLMGNLLPLALSVPFGAWGFRQMLLNERIVGWELAWLGAMPVSAWVFMNFLGLFQNEAMKREIARKLRLGPPSEPPERFFVGFARPAFVGLLDPHEDVGFLFLHPDRLEFRGDGQDAMLARDQILGVRFRPNIHTVVGLGRWVSVEGTAEGKPVRLLVEPRERRTLLGNLKFSRILRDRLDSWLKNDDLPSKD
jgi:hypothetical protein